MAKGDVHVTPERGVIRLAENRAKPRKECVQKLYIPCTYTVRLVSWSIMAQDLPERSLPWTPNFPAVTF